MIQISAVIITFNEAANIERCVRSVADVVDDILVVDSFSTDSTVAIAEGCGARVVQHPWEDYNKQREFAAHAALHDHVLALDADEFLSPELLVSLREVREKWTSDCYSFNRLNRIGDRWIRHGGWYPDRKVRLFDRSKVTFVSNRGHDSVVPIAGATTDWLAGDLLHYANSNLHDRVVRVNQTSTEAARFDYLHGKKSALWRILLKPPARFLGEYFLRQGFRDGFYGLAIARTSAQYVYLRESKLREMHRLGRGYSKDNYRS
jgi:glycosyltransferase involved in cell wall biosynthesis